MKIKEGILNSEAKEREMKKGFASNKEQKIN